MAILPGLDSLLVLRYSIGGAKPGFAAAMGVAPGGLFWAVLVAIGLAALFYLAVLPQFLTVVTFTGAMTLGWSKLSSPRAPSRCFAGRRRPTGSTAQCRDPRSARHRHGRLVRLARRLIRRPSRRAGSAGCRRVRCCRRPRPS
ncbi:MAG: LysE family transporter [Rhodococcus sp. (in: high G+C Gram-positive bacteria)]